MKIEPETPEEERWVRDTATRTTAIAGMDLAMVLACDAWVTENPKRPGPGSVLLWDIEAKSEMPRIERLRFVQEDMTVVDVRGDQTNGSDWRLDQYRVLFDSGETG